MMLIREVVLRGVREVDGLLFDPGSDELVVRSWVEGAELLRLDDDMLMMRHPNSVLMRCESARGIPLIDIEGRLVALPMNAKQLAEAPSGLVVRLEGGRVAAHDPIATVDPSALLDLRDWHVEHPLTAVQPTPATGQVRRPAPPAAPTLALEERDFDVRSSLGAHPEPSARDRRRWRRVQQASTRSRPAGGGGQGRFPRGPSPLAQAWSRWRHRRYLNDLTRLFAQGRLDDALRRAIPFGGEEGDAAMRAPQPRRDLRIDPNRRRPGSVVSLDSGLRAELEQRYRSAVAQLDREGRALDAAFVLAELLDRPAEACEFLERHGELKLAAELAEARTSSHPEMVRLWWRAGDRARAVALARRHGCFASALARLERSGHRDEAQSMRREWMGHLLAAGDIVGAYDAGSGLEGEEVRAMRRRLMDLGVEHGGELRARMLARQLRAGDDSPHRDIERVLADPLARRDREIIAEALVGSKGPVDHPATVRELARLVLTEPAGRQRSLVESLTGLAEDPVFTSDMPALSTLPRQVDDGHEPLWIELDPSDRGQLAVRDARLLPSGWVAVALDGPEVRLVKPSGRTAAAFDVAADLLVPADSGTRILAVRLLDPGVVGITEIDVLSRRTRPFGELAATMVCDTFDGANWFIANQTQLWMLDMLADGPVALWHQADLGGTVIAMARDPGALLVAVPLAQRDARTGQDLALVRRYGLPDLRDVGSGSAIRPDAPVLQPGGDLVDGVAAAAGIVVERERSDGESVTITVTSRAADAPIVVIKLAGAAGACAHVDNGSLIVGDDVGRIEVIGLEDLVRRTPLRLQVQ